MRSERYYFSKWVPAFGVLFGLPAAGLFLWASADPTFLPNSDDPFLRWLASQPEILARLLFLATAAIVLDGIVLAPLVPYLRSRIAIKFTSNQLIINGKYGPIRLPREAVVHAYRRNRWTVVIHVKDAFKPRSWYGWRVVPSVQTGNISGLSADDFLTRLETWT